MALIVSFRNSAKCSYNAAIWQENLFCALRLNRYESVEAKKSNRLYRRRRKSYLQAAIVVCLLLATALRCLCKVRLIDIEIPIFHKSALYRRLSSLENKFCAAVSMFAVWRFLSFQVHLKNFAQKKIRRRKCVCISGGEFQSLDKCISALSGKLCIGRFYLTMKEQTTFRFPVNSVFYRIFAIACASRNSLNSAKTNGSSARQN